MRKIYTIIVIVIFIFLYGALKFVEDETSIDKIIFCDVPSFKVFSESTKIVYDYAKENNSENVILKIKAKSDFYFDIGEIDMKISMDEADKIKKARIDAGAEYFENLNQKLFNLLPKFDYKNIYISKYFGYIMVEVENNLVYNNDCELLKKIAKIDLVDAIYVYTRQQKIESYIGNAKESINILEENRTSQTDGAGVRVGLLDGGIVDTSLSQFSDINIVCRDHWLYVESIDDHANKMASLITGSVGMASKANLYSVESFGTNAGELDWLIDQNVDVINMSFGFTANPGTYDVNSAEVDELIWNYGITCCVAAGNTDSNNNGYITNPALAYNAITVGAGQNRIALFNDQCQNEYSEVDKPTLVSYSDLIYIGMTGLSVGGSSAATALTTGTVAGLMKYNPALKLKPGLVTALLTASSYEDGTIPFNCDSNLNAGHGSGFLDHEKARQNAYNVLSSVTNSSQTDISIVFEYEVCFIKGENIRISACWLAKSTGTVASLSYSDYDLCIFRPEGGQIDCTLSAYNNVEMLNLTIPYTGVYTIRVIQSGDLAHTTPTDICVAWTYEIV